MWSRSGLSWVSKKLLLTDLCARAIWRQDVAMMIVSVDVVQHVQHWHAVRIVHANAAVVLPHFRSWYGPAPTIVIVPNDLDLPGHVYRLRVMTHPSHAVAAGQQDEDDLR